MDFTGDIKNLIALVREYRDGPAALLQGTCHVLRNLTLDDDCEDVCCAEGGVEAVVAVIKRYSVKRHADDAHASEELLRQACLLLCNMTRKAANQIKAGKAGSVRALVNVVRRCSSSDCSDDSINEPCLLNAACSALRNVTVDADNQVAAGESGAVEALVDVLNRHRDGPWTVLQNACDALHNITFNDANEERCGAARGVEAVVAVIRQACDRRGPAELLQEAIGALINVTTTTDNQIRAGKSGALAALTDVIEMFCSTGPVSLLHSSCWALCNIAVATENHHETGAAGTVKALVKLVKHLASDEPADTVRLALNALQNLTRCNAANSTSTYQDAGQVDDDSSRVVT
jgi:hypothetical protein